MKKNSAHEDDNDDKTIYCFINNNQEVHNNYVVYLSKNITDSFIYNELFDILFNATEKDTIRFVINNYGGNIETAIQLYNLIKACKSQTITEVQGCALSSAAIVFMAGKKKVIGDYSYIMIHNYSDEVYGKGQELKSCVDFSFEHITKFLYDVFRDLLMHDEFNDMINGKDLWFNADEVNKRLKNKKNKQK